MPIAGILAELGLGVIGTLLGGLLGGGGGGRPDLPAGLGWKLSTFITKGYVHTDFGQVYGGNMFPRSSFVTPYPGFHADCIQDTNTGLVVGYYFGQIQEVIEFSGYTLEGIPIDSYYPELASLIGKRMPNIFFPKGAYYGGVKPEMIAHRLVFPDKTYQPGQSVPYWNVLNSVLNGVFKHGSQAADLFNEMQVSAGANAGVVYGKIPSTPGGAVSPVSAGLAGLASGDMMMLGAVGLLALLVLRGK